MDSNTELAAELSSLSQKATKGAWKAAIWHSSGTSDTVCIKAGDDEIIGWNGFDGVPCTKAEIRANARLIAKMQSNLPLIIKALRLTALTQQPADHIPDASNMVPAEQIADGALGDAGIVGELAAMIRRNLYRADACMPSYPIGLVEPVIRVAMTQARAQALEEAAKVAESRSVWDMIKQNDADTSWHQSQIASAIRALQPHGQGGGE